MQEKHIVTSACSYKGSFFGLHKFKNLVKGTVLHDLGQAGRSNRWISQSIIWQIEQLKSQKVDPKNILVLASWTSIDRRDLIIDRKSNDIHRQIDYRLYSLPEYYNQKMQFRQFHWYWQCSNEAVYNHNQPSGLLSSCNVLPNYNSEWAIEQIVGNYQRYIQSELESWYMTLTACLELQSYCKLNNIAYLFFSWQDIFHSTSNCFFIRGQSLDKQILNYNQFELRSKKYPELNYLYNQLDFSQWIFYRTRGTDYGGVAEFCLDNNEFGTETDNEHPNRSGYNEFCKIYLEPWVFKKLTSN